MDLNLFNIIQWYNSLSKNISIMDIKSSLSNMKWGKKVSTTFDAQ